MAARAEHACRWKLPGTLCCSTRARACRVWRAWTPGRGSASRATRSMTSGAHDIILDRPQPRTTKGVPSRMTCCACLHASIGQSEDAFHCGFHLGRAGVSVRVDICLLHSVAVRPLHMLLHLTRSPRTGLSKLSLTASGVQMYRPPSPNSDASRMSCNHTMVHSVPPCLT